MKLLPLTLTSILLTSSVACSAEQKVAGEKVVDLKVTEEKIAVVNQLQIAINEVRADGGACERVSSKYRPVLVWNEKLTKVAAKQSAYLARQNRLTHTGANGDKLVTRVDDQRYEWRALAENLAQSPGDAETIVNLWLNSPPHLKNMCSSDYSEIGAARVAGYWTAVFAKPLK